eukprot:CAMPEP_0119348466 /NCGR_PEP_ID=MMETSP1333-20130426/109060_1 /TAXON_ID=418940 /ORGANISM="Scyphosphaera apsteinii, Strain RCC1455" /LENGTH=77 /DNA_ID=CAMNT_0007361053 /DNA_START=9 /DNA_END=242 /DNA_ORIENTATION=+
MSAVIKIAEVLPTTQISSLNLSANSFDDEGAAAAAVAKALQLLPRSKIIELNLRSTNIDEAAKEKLQDVASGITLHF